MKLLAVTVALVVTIGLGGCASAPQGANSGSHVSLYGTVDMGISTVRNSGN